MGLIQSGVDSTLLIIDPTFHAARISLRPPELTGAYRVAMKTGNIAASTAAGSMLAAFRYTGSANCVITSVRIGLHLVTGYTQGSIAFGLWCTRSYSATETTNYTAATLTGDNQNLRTSHSAASVSFGVATTTGITGGTGTDDTQAMAGITFNLPSTIVGQQVQDFFITTVHSHPLVLANNEGFRIRNDTAFAATGTSNLVVNVAWFETTSY